MFCCWAWQFLTKLPIHLSYGPETPLLVGGGVMVLVWVLKGIGVTQAYTLVKTYQKLSGHFALGKFYPLKKKEKILQWILSSSWQRACGDSGDSRLVTVAYFEMHASSRCPHGGNRDGDVHWRVVKPVGHLFLVFSVFGEWRGQIKLHARECLWRRGY